MHHGPVGGGFGVVDGFEEMVEIVGRVAGADVVEPVAVGI